MKQAWVRHLGLVREFPRDLGFVWPRAGQPFSRYEVRNLQEFVDTVEENITSHSCFVQVYSNRQASEGVIDKVFVDIDADDLNTAWKRWQAFLRHLDNLEYRHRSLFTAGQGFHVFMDCEPVEVNWRQLRDFQMQLGEVAGVELDTSVMGDKNRLCRLPMTPNVKSVKDGEFRWCVPVEDDWDLDKIIRVSKREAEPPTQRPVPSDRLRKDLEALPSDHPDDTFDDADSYEDDDDGERNASGAKRAEFAAMVDWIMEEGVDQVTDGRHRIMHYLLVPALVHIGASNEAIIETCKRFVEETGKVYSGQGGYASYVRDSILRTRQEDWWPWSLETFNERYPDVFDDVPSLRSQGSQR